MKFLLSSFADHEVLRARFKCEARLLAQLSHPGIIAAIDYGEDAGEPFLVMEYVAGRHLGLLVAEHPNGLPVMRAVRIIEQILDALATAHAASVTHRDIKAKKKRRAQKRTPRTKAAEPSAWRVRSPCCH